VKNGPSPAWLQRRLKAIGLRPISALVDITNYITFAHGRPLHVFDADKVKGSIRARMAREGETIEALGKSLYDFAGGALRGLYDGLWDAIDAVVTSSETWVEALNGLVRKALLALAKWAGWEALMAFAQWASSSFMNVAKGIAFGAYSAVAIGAGAGGLAMSASSGSSGQTSTPPQSSSQSSTQSFGHQVEKKHDINVHVFLGDAKSPTAALLIKKQIQAQVAA
jgi:hypothetical protein